MAIKRDVKIVIAQESSKLEESIYVYAHDRGIDLYFDIIENKFSFTGTQSESIIARNSEIMYAGLTVKKPSGEGFFRPVLPIQENRVLFHLEHNHTDDFNEIGIYELQIHLYDKFDNRVSIPPFSLEVKPLVVSDVPEILSNTDAIVNYGVIDKSTIAENEKVLFTIEHNGDTPYIKTVWKAGDIITEAKINNMEQGIENVSKALENLEVPSVEGLATEEYVNEQIEAIEIPSVDGLATEDFVNEQISNIDMSEFAKNEDVEAKINEVKEQISSIQIPSVEGLASEDFVTEKITEATEGLASENYVDEKIANIEFPETDLSNYPTKDEVTSEIEGAIADVEIPSIDGLATEEYVDEAIRTIELTPGEKGQDGKDGKSAYEIAVEQGFEGNEEAWLASLKGEQGEKGEQGIQGIQGEKGDRGEQGIQGIQGIQGEQGVSGRDGVDGKDGIDGKSVELQKSATHIQWKQTDGTWQDLIALEDLKGDKGEQGDGSTIDFSNYYTKAEADKAILDALENVNVDLSDYATLEYVREQIANVSVDLSDYYTKSEVNQLVEDNKFDPTGLATEEFVNEKIEGIDIPDISPLATKEELEAKANEIIDMIPEPQDISHLATKEELQEAIEGIDIPDTGTSNENTIIGLVGAGVKVASPPTGMFDDIPEPIGGDGLEYIGKWMYSIEGSYSTEYVVCHLFNNPSKNYYPCIYVDDSHKTDTLFRTSNFSSSYKTMEAYKRTSSSASWSTLGSITTFYPQRKQYLIYHCDLPIYTDIGKGGIYQEATTSAPISNLDLANKQGNYLVNVSKDDYKTLQNTPNVTLNNDLETVLKCYKRDDALYQEMNIEGYTYSRRVGDAWSTTKADSFMQKNAIGEIRASENSVVDIPDAFNSCPVPNISSRIIGELDFKYASNTYCRIYLLKDKENEMFYRHDSGSSYSYIGSTVGGVYAIRYLYTNGAWSLDTSSSIYVRGNPSDCEIYRNTLPICNGIGSTTFDKTTIIKEATSDIEGKPTINDFDNATTTGHYNVCVETDTTVANAPFEGELSGILKVTNANDVVHQVLETTDNKTFKRMLNETWSDWQEVGSSSSSGSTGDVNLENYYTKEEVNELDTSSFEIKENFYKAVITGDAISNPITHKELNRLRPSSNHRAVGLTTENGTFIAFAHKNSESSISLVSGVYSVILKGEDVVIYKKEDNLWTDVTSTFTDNTITTSNPIDSQVFLCEMFLVNTSGTHGLSVKPMPEKRYVRVSDVREDGRYLVKNGNTGLGLPTGVANGTLDIITVDKRITYTLYDSDNYKMYRRYAMIGGSSGNWREVDNSSYSIDNYYTKTQTDTAISKAIEDAAISGVDLSNYATKEYVDEAVSGIDIPEVDLSNYPTNTDLTNAIHSVHNTIDSNNNSFNNSLTQIRNEVTQTRSELNVVRTNLATTTDRLVNLHYNKTEVDEKIDGVNESIEEINDNLHDNYYKKTEIDETVSGINDVLTQLSTPVTDTMSSYDYKNADGMIENYNWINLNGLKIMWINVKLSEDEYNTGVSGAMMKTLNFPIQAQIFNSIFMANITSYCREGANTLSRIVQNAEVISPTSVRGRWRHTDNTYPRIDRFTIMAIGF